MASLITKFKYLKPSGKLSVGGYARYIATREGAERLDDTQGLAPATVTQKQLIWKLLRDFPDSVDSHEYTDYKTQGTISAASDFITQTIEANAYKTMTSKTYADYIATRPRAERFCSHGLFTDDGVQVQLSKVSEELNLHGGNVWTAIISLRREDAERLGFNTGERWRDMLRTQTETLATNLKIPMENLRWFAAFHNESHHPHVHLIAYSTIENEGYLTKQGVMNIRSSLAKDIFTQDMESAYEKQTEYRDELRQSSRILVAEIVKQINEYGYDNTEVEDLLLKLSDRLKTFKGKKQYGYLPPKDKDTVDTIVALLADDERIKRLYELWYEQKENVLHIYSDTVPGRIPLEQNLEFKPIRNAVIQEAMNLMLEPEAVEDIPDEVISEPEPLTEESESPELPPTMSEYERTVEQAESGSKWAQYQLAKLLLDRDSDKYDPQTAVSWLIKSAKQNYTVAQYMLGKLFLRGEDVPKNAEYAVRWLEEAVADGNQYAEYLLGKTLLKGDGVESNLLRAETLLRISSYKGNRYAAYTLGKAYLDGNVLIQNIPEAVRLLTESANHGFAPAQYILGRLYYCGEAVARDIPKALELLEKAAAQNNSYAAYLAGKIYLTEDTVKDIGKVIRLLELSASAGNSYAECALGKLYLYGKDIPRDTEKAVQYLTSAAEHGNAYAAQLLKSITANRNWSAVLGSFRLLQNLCRIIQNRIEDERRGKIAGIDRKLKRQIDEKKAAHGIRQSE